MNDASNSRKLYSLLVVEKGNEQKFLDLFDKHELDSAVIGEVTDTNRFVLTYDDEVYADIPVEPLSHESTVYFRRRRKRL
ncbi:AIR synthase-related protein [Staphylococcus aureus]